MASTTPARLARSNRLASNLLRRRGERHCRVSVPKARQWSFAVAEDASTDFAALQNGSDIRGVAVDGVEGEPVNLTQVKVYCIGAAFGEWLVRQIGSNPLEGDSVAVSIGRDPRRSGPSFQHALAQGLRSRGISVDNIGLSSTPACFMSLVLPRQEGSKPYDGSIMITASHLPWNRNGLKFFTRDGGLGKHEIKEILERARAIFDSDTQNPAPLESEEEMSFLDAYADHLKGIIKEGVNHPEHWDQPLKGLHVIVDAGNGSGGFFTDKVLQPLGATTAGSVLLEPDGDFPTHSPNPEDKDAVEYAAKATKEAGADLGVVFDTDVDRSAVVAPDGSVLNRNLLIGLMSAVVLRERPGATIVTDSVTSNGLSEFIEAKGGKHFRFKRGYKNVIDKGIELNNQGIDTPLMIETSGHGAMRENYFLDDGAYMAVKAIIETMRRRLQGQGGILELLSDLPQPAEEREARLKIKADNFQDAGKSILDEFQDFGTRQGWSLAPENHEGWRFIIQFGDGKTGWVLMRQSLHDPLLVLNAESEVTGGLKQILNPLVQWLQKKEDVLDTSPLEMMEMRETI